MISPGSAGTRNVRNGEIYERPEIKAYFPRKSELADNATLTVVPIIT